MVAPVLGRFAGVSSVLNMFAAPHPAAGVEQLGGRWVAASPDDLLHRFVEADETPSVTAERIVALADGQHRLSEIADVLEQEFEGADRRTIEQDVCDFIQGLVDARVLMLSEHPLGR